MLTDKPKEFSSPTQKSPDLSINLIKAQDQCKQEIIYDKLSLEKLSENIKSLEPFEEEHKIIKELNTSLKEIEKHKKNLSTKDRSQWGTINPTTLNAFDKVSQLIDPSSPEHTELVGITRKKREVNKAVLALRLDFPSPENQHSKLGPRKEYNRITYTEQKSTNEELRTKDTIQKNYDQLSLNTQKNIDDIQQYYQNTQWQVKEEKSAFKYLFDKIVSNWKKSKEAFEEALKNNEVSKGDKLLTDMQNHSSEDIKSLSDETISLKNGSLDSTIGVKHIIASLRSKNYTTEISEYIRQIHSQIKKDCADNPDKAKQTLFGLDQILNKMQGLRNDFKTLAEFSSEKALPQHSQPEDTGIKTDVQHSFLIQQAKEKTIHSTEEYNSRKRKVEYGSFADNSQDNINIVEQKKLKVSETTSEVGECSDQDETINVTEVTEQPTQSEQRDNQMMDMDKFLFRQRNFETYGFGPIELDVEIKETFLEKLSKDGIDYEGRLKFFTKCYFISKDLQELQEHNADLFQAICTEQKAAINHAIQKFNAGEAKIGLVFSATGRCETEIKEALSNKRKDH